jgi:transcriptional regulator with XRE-family HTH domain
MDLVLKLRELRRLRGLTQGDVARLSGIGVKTISSFETGDRIGSLKFSQLERLLSVYGTTPREFFGRAVEKDLAPWDLNEEEVAEKRLLEDLGALPKELQRKLFARFQLMVEAVVAVYEPENGRLAPDSGLFERELSRSGRY